MGPYNTNSKDFARILFAQQTGTSVKSKKSECKMYPVLHKHDVVITFYANFRL